MKKTLGLAVGSLITLSAGVASAHPGHGGSDGLGLMHQLIDHPVLAIGAIASVIGLAMVAMRVLPRR
jgi:hypothetical protein